MEKVHSADDSAVSRLSHTAPIFGPIQTRRVVSGTASQTNLTRTADAPRWAAVIPPRFLVLEKLGQGGMGVVHRALDLELGREIALKSLNIPRADDLYRLKREFRSLAQIHHPNLIVLDELFANNGHCFFTMEFISGVNFISFARAASSPDREPTCDYLRLRDGARQLASAVAAVHSASTLHRDLKPSNVMVTDSGRVVLLDFGLATAVCARNATTKGAGLLLGTRGYISPEQARGEPLTAAADWYGFGVTLFEAATGRLPFDDAFKTFLPDRDSEKLRHIRTHAADAPEDLDQLIAALLSCRASRRPKAEDVIRVLAGHRHFSHAMIAPPRKPLAGPLQTCAAEAAAMNQALDWVKSDNTAVVHLHGDSCAPQTELARQFADDIESSGALVLRGHCHPKEIIAFNALDGVMDDLSDVLEHRSCHEVQALLSPDAPALSRLFPVLGRLEATAETSFEDTPATDAETLHRARRALKNLLGALGDRRPLVIWIDDAELGDRESGNLLTELLHPPDAPAMLLLLSYTDCDTLNDSMIGALTPAEGCSLQTFDIRI